MKHSRFVKWLQNVYRTSEEEILCSECLDLIPTYVDLEVWYESLDDKLPQVRQHVDQCQVCREEYKLLLDLARWEVEREDALP